MSIESLPCLLFTVSCPYWFLSNSYLYKLPTKLSKNKSHVSNIVSTGTTVLQTTNAHMHYDPLPYDKWLGKPWCQPFGCSEMYLRVNFLPHALTLLSLSHTHSFPSHTVSGICHKILLSTQKYLHSSS